MHSIISFIQRIEGKWRGIFGRYWQSCKSLDEVLSGDSKFFLALKIVLKSNPLLPGPRSYVFFFYQDYLSRTLKTHRTAWQERGPSFIPLYHFHPLTNSQTFICNFACEVTITYFWSHSLYLPEWFIDDLMLVFVWFLDDLIVGFCYINLTRETGGMELVSTITLALLANRLTKRANHQ